MFLPFAVEKHYYLFIKLETRGLADYAITNDIPIAPKKHIYTIVIMILIVPSMPSSSTQMCKSDDRRPCASWPPLTLISFNAIARTKCVCLCVLRCGSARAHLSVKRTIFLSMGICIHYFAVLNRPL